MTSEAVKHAMAREQEAIDAFVERHAHVDTGWRCLVDHGKEGACYRCGCGKFIAPKAWAAHSGEASQ